MCDSARIRTVVMQDVTLPGWEQLSCKMCLTHVCVVDVWLCQDENNDHTTCVWLLYVLCLIRPGWEQWRSSHTKRKLNGHEQCREWYTRRWNFHLGKRSHLCARWCVPLSILIQVCVTWKYLTLASVIVDVWNFDIFPFCILCPPPFFLLFFS